MKDSTSMKRLLKKCVSWFAFIVMLMINVAIGTTAQAQYREESSALEQIYESRARTALNTVMRPNEYSIVLSVDINRDPKQLLEVENEIEKMGLPGVPGVTLPENMNVSNKLHELRNKISVHIILDESVSKEREAAAKALAAMKLHLDESAGDTMVIGRAVLIPKDPAAQHADLLPELSWRMWALVIIVSLLALGLFFAMVMRKKTSESEKPLNEAEKKAIDKDQEDDKAEEAIAQAVAAEEAQLAAESKKDLDAIEIYEKKKALLSLATKYPEAAAKAIEEEFEKGNRREVLLTFETLEWETAKPLFRGLSHRTWVRLGAELAARTEKASTEEVLKALESCHRSVVSKYLELSEGDQENPFSFLTKLVPEDMKRLLTGQSPTDIASICVFLDTNQKRNLLETLPEDLQQATLLQITRLKEVPFEIVKRVTSSLKEKLQFIKENPSVSFDGQKFLIQLLQELDVLSEQKFLEKLSSESPDEMQALRHHYLQFTDLHLLPEEMLADAFGTVDMKILTASIYGADEATRFYCLSVLPEKRAKMIEKDLSYIKELSRRDVLSAQRVLLKSVNSALMMAGKIPGDYIQKKLELAPVTEAA